MKPPSRALRLAVACILAGAAVAAPASRDADGPDCARPTGTTELAICAAIEADRAGSEMQAVYALAQQAAAGLDAGCDHCRSRDALETAQRAWEGFRDRDCAAVHAFYGDGSARSVMPMRCLAGHNRERSRQLRMHYELEP